VEIDGLVLDSELQFLLALRRKRAMPPLRELTLDEIRVVSP